MRGLLAAALAALAVAALAPSAFASGTTSTPTAAVFDGKGHLVKTPLVPSPKRSSLTLKQALADFERYPKVAAWLSHYPHSGRSHEATYDRKTGEWTVKIWWRNAGEIAQGTVVDATGEVTEAWTGPQVAWGMARGSPGAFGGTAINNPWVWGAFCLVFLVGLGDWRRPFSLRNLDLLFLLSPTASLWYFNHGDVFTAVPLFYPLLAWVVLRGTWIGLRNRGTPGAPRWPVWVLLAATIFLAGFRVGLNVERSNVIDVGYSGVIGAQRIVTGTAPWGNFPIEHTKKSCGTADASGEIREWVQTNGRCESANPEGDTYGPVAYESYIPGYLVMGWSGKWDDLPAAHFTSIAVDLLTLLGLFLVGLRFGGQRLGAVLAFAWAAYPVHPVRLELEHERRAHALLPRLGLLARLETGGARRPRGALGLDEVRVPARRTALAHVPGPKTQLALRAGLRRRDARGLLGPAPRAGSVPRGARLLDADGRLPDRA